MGPLLMLCGLIPTLLPRPTPYPAAQGPAHLHLLIPAPLLCLTLSCPWLWLILLAHLCGTSPKHCPWTLPSSTSSFSLMELFLGYSASQSSTCPAAQHLPHSPKPTLQPSTYPTAQRSAPQPSALPRSPALCPAAQHLPLSPALCPTAEHLAHCVC